MSSITTLLETMRMLRDKDDGCPWDIEQTLESLSPCVVEEAYEVTDAIASKDYENLKEELGDVLLQVIFQAEIANESELFNFDEIVDTLNKKLIRTFADIPASLPPILKAKKIQKKASKKGFDWKKSIDVIEKVEEELKELKHEIQQNNKENSQEELGDLLFSIINLSRHLGIDASEAINQANHKFVNRFRLMEEEISKDNREIDNLTSDELEEFWVKIKSHE
ncbi:MAG: nucleoside triphosphate pyrophosphohydrolase [Proteobacteria bacterium]|nr:nucleoside triphosphate pyrophosphohydrolase [Pseudomonadota bacterium]